MKEVLLFRLPCKDCTPGAVYIDSELVCFSLEPKWHNNERNLSCVPCGTYTAKMVFDRKTPGGMHITRTFLLEKVENRTGILFHIGNTVRDTSGCILLGENLSSSNGRIRLTNSGTGFFRFMSILHSEEQIRIMINEVYTHD